jgi:hypothetical protein
MSKRVAAALLLVAAGATIGAGGSSAALHLAQMIWTNLSLIILAIACMALLASIAPIGSVAGPLLLVVLAGGVWALQAGWITVGERWLWTLLLIGTGVLVAADPAGQRRPDMTQRRWAMLFPRTITPESIPGKVRVVAAGNRLRLDLRTTNPGAPVTEIFASIWLGKVELLLPNDWAVVAGRVTAARAIEFSGTMTTAASYTDPSGSDQKRLEALVDPPSRPFVGVVHVLGVLGRIDVLVAS